MIEDSGFDPTVHKFLGDLLGYSKTKRKIFELNKEGLADRERRRAADNLRSSRRRPVLLLEEASQAVVLVEMEKEKKEKRK